MQERKMNKGMGPFGNCICPVCGYKTSHTPGIPCRDEKCPKCEVSLVREGSYHDNLIKKKKGGK